ncbi:MAG TPA: DUF3857 domain-containing protein [Deltaproteobacteria bacterium]|nr:DUF3857 domain-containing protein [Deltaproteobacteria bacterium]HPR55971.1 DUF3857 domain-containing protein [Deltaproteobacteria bacterium]
MQKTLKTCSPILSVYILLSILCGSIPAPAVEWHPLDTAEIVEQSRAATSERYPDADVVVVDQHTWTKYAPDGTYVEWFEEYIKVLTEKGRRGYRTLTSSFTIPYNTTRFTLVEVISEDGSTRTVDVAKNSREMVDSSQMSSNIYNPNDRMIQVSIPELGITDTVHFITRDDFVKARMAGEFSDFIPLEGTDPILHARITIVAPTGRPLKSMILKNEIPGTVTFLKTVEGDETVYQWTGHDVPRAFAEPEMPPLYTQAQRLLVSTIPDWQTVSRWYWNLSKPHLDQTTPAMRSTVQRLVKGKKTRQEKIDAVFFWVSQQVRYLGITAETEAPGYEPHPVSMTFDRRAGVCRDKAALLVAMLRLAGIEAYPVLIMKGPKKDPEVPQPFFNHAIAGIRKKDGSFQLMDPTDENTRELFPSYLNNMSYLAATPAGETLMTSPIEPAEKNMMRIDTKGSLDEDGTLHGTTTLTFEGINDNAYRGHLSMLSDMERKDYFEKSLKKVLPTAALLNFSIRPENMLDTGKALQAVIEFSAERYPLMGGGVLFLPLFRFGDTLGLTNYLVQKMGLRERKYTYMTDTTCGVEETLSIRLDPSIGVPREKTVQEADINAGADWLRSLEISDGVLKGKNVFRLNRTEYTPEQYQKLQETLRKVEKANRFMPAFSLTPSSPAAGAWYDGFNPDAVILDEAVEVTVNDRTSLEETVSRKIKILTYAGKKKFSEIHIPYNPVWEEVNLDRAAVVSPQGDVTKIEPREINVMDQEWVGMAPRYPAGKILVASLPHLQEGSVIEYRYTLKKKDDPGFLITGVFQGEEPIERKKLSISIPDGMVLHMEKADSGFHGDCPWMPFADGFVTETRTVAQGRTVIEYSARYVPPIRPEQDLPPVYSIMPTVFASPQGGKPLAADVLRGLQKASDEGGVAAERAQALLHGSAGDERITAIRDFIARNIKVVGISLSELPLTRISPADTTLSDGYGRQADIAVLLHAMLKGIGYEPEFVLASSVPAIAALQKPFMDFPSIEWFSAVLVKIRTTQGDVYLGDTDQYTALGAVANDGNLGLNLHTGGMETIRAATPRLKDATDHRISIDLDAQGSALVTHRRTFYGMDAARFSRNYDEMTPEERRRRYQEIVSSESRSAEPVSPYNVSTGQYPVVEEYTVRIPSYAILQGDLMTLGVPSLSRGISYVLSDDRSNPLYRGVNRAGHSTVEILLPEGVADILRHPPLQETVDLVGMGEVRSSTSIVRPSPDAGGHPGRIRILMEQTIESREGIIPPERYVELLAAHRVLSHPEMRAVVVRLK